VIGFDYLCDTNDYGYECDDLDFDDDDYGDGHDDDYGDRNDDDDDDDDYYDIVVDF